jgi:beta-xylosidase
VYGEKWFWAPEVYYADGRFLMYFSAEERICVATSDSPLGPFKQEVQKPIIEGEKSIDNTLFIDQRDGFRCCATNTCIRTSKEKNIVSFIKQAL